MSRDDITYLSTSVTFIHSFIQDDMLPKYRQLCCEKDMNVCQQHRHHVVINVYLDAVYVDDHDFTSIFLSSTVMIMMMVMMMMMSRPFVPTNLTQKFAGN